MRKKWIGMAVLLVSLVLCGVGVFAAGGYTKDSGVALQPSFVAIEGASTLSESLTDQLEYLYGTGKYTGDMVYSNGSEQIISVYQDGSKIGWHLVDAEGVIELYDQEDHEYIFVRKSVTEKISAPLMKEIEEASDELIPVYVWLKDIDTEEIISAIPETMAVNGRSTSSDSEQTYIMQKRESLSEAYSAYNDSFLNSVFAKENETQVNTSLMIEEITADQATGSDVFSFASAYAPLCLLELSASQIMELTEDERVAEIGLIPEYEMTSCAATGGASVQGTYVRDTNGYTGEGAVVGILEITGMPNKTLPELAEADITLRVEENEEIIISDHATRVAAIICGKTVGLAPDCKVYATYVRDQASVEGDFANFINQMEWLLSKGVHVINLSISMEVPNGEYGIYNVLDKWVDHVDMNHDVLVVVAAGNSQTELFLEVNSPATAYNGIAVGAYDDNGDTNHSNDMLVELSCYKELDYQEYQDNYREYEELYGDAFIVAPEKPDLIAPGMNIDIPGMSVDESNDEEKYLNDGTSFAAPFVTATVAQMIDAKPELKTQPGIIKAALLASAFRKINPNDYSSAGGSMAFSDKEGAGKLDSKNAIYVVASTNYTYEYFWNSTTSHTITIYADTSETQMRVALTWLKQNVLNADELPDEVEHDDYEAISLVNDRPLSDWDLEIYDPNGNLIGYSYMKNGNVEVVEFDPEITGNYTIKIIKRGGTTEKEFVYLAWW